ncbi:MAG: B12-binding domain-containing radical SAM protein [Oliverpabstia sp.]
MAERKHILLAAINAKYIHSNLAVYSLKAYVKKYQNQIGLAEYTINQNLDDILKGIYRDHPEVLCISCYIWNISYVKNLIREVHKVLPDTAIWLGGPEVSYDARKVLEEHPEVTGVMKGEGEVTFLELAGFYLEGISELAKIEGITYRDGDQIQENPWRGITDLSTIPFVYKDLKKFENRIIYYESSRGCPFSCSYCLSSIDKKLRFRDLELVKEELQFFLDHNVPQVKFVDRTFNCKHDHAMAIWKYLIAHDNGITNFHFEVAADLLNEEEIALIRTMRPGMIQLEIGVQSTNPDTIREIHRKMDFAQVSEVVTRVQEGHNVHQHLDLIAGLPYEDYDSFGKSFCDVYQLRPQQLQLGFLKVLKGSFMYQAAPEYGCVCQSREPYEVLYTRWLPYDDVLRLKLVEEMVEVYYNSNQFGKTLRAIEKLFDNPFALYEALGAFYDKKGYMDISHTRIRRYEILQEFLQEYVDEEQMDYYRQLMICDLYAREKMKTRPAWAKDLKAYKRDIREFYLKEEETHEYLPEYEGYDEKQLARMTHLERMDYDPDTGVREPCWILFDYRSRDVLTYDAKMVKLSLVDIMQNNCLLPAGEKRMTDEQKYVFRYREQLVGEDEG